MSAQQHQRLLRVRQQEQHQRQMLQAGVMHNLAATLQRAKQREADLGLQLEEAQAALLEAKAHRMAVEESERQAAEYLLATAARVRDREDILKRAVKLLFEDSSSAAAATTTTLPLDRNRTSGSFILPDDSLSTSTAAASSSSSSLSLPSSATEEVRAVSLPPTPLSFQPTTSTTTTSTLSAAAANSRYKLVLGGALDGLRLLRRRSLADLHALNNNKPASSPLVQDRLALVGAKWLPLVRPPRVLKPGDVVVVAIDSSPVVVSSTNLGTNSAHGEIARTGGSYDGPIGSSGSENADFDPAAAGEMSLFGTQGVVVQTLPWEQHDFATTPRRVGSADGDSLNRGEATAGSSTLPSGSLCVAVRVGGNLYHLKQSELAVWASWDDQESEEEVRPKITKSRSARDEEVYDDVLEMLGAVGIGTEAAAAAGLLLMNGQQEIPKNSHSSTKKKSKAEKKAALRRAKKERALNLD
jgi:hypothetical protein